MIAPRNCSAAAQRIALTDASATAVVAGWGAALDASASPSALLIKEVWKIANDALAYPNAELIRKALVRIAAAGQHRSGSARSLRHRSRAGPFHQAECSICPRRTGNTKVRGHRSQSSSPGIRRPSERASFIAIFHGGAVITVRPGAFKPFETAAVSGTDHR